MGVAGPHSVQTQGGWGEEVPRLLFKSDGEYK